MSEEPISKKREAQKEIASKFIEKPVNFLIKHNVTPNILSYLGLLCMILAAFFISLGTIHMFLFFSWPGPFFIFLAGTFDVFDGEVARRTGKESAAGAFLDSNLDRISDAILILGLILGGLLNFMWGYIILFLSIMISYIRSRAENEGIDMRGIGLMERAERVLTLFGALIIETWVYLITFWIYGKPSLIEVPFLATQPVTWFWVIFILIYVFSLVLTVYQRISFTYKHLKEKKSEN
ncbi:MAG: CDP-alcohol phosphatidyltransferase family protein [Promethearchaeota archaeon]